jgi:hypothetical protein
MKKRDKGQEGGRDEEEDKTRLLPLPVMFRKPSRHKKYFFVMKGYGNRIFAYERSLAHQTLFYIQQCLVFMIFNTRKRCVRPVCHC